MSLGNCLILNNNWLTKYDSVRLTRRAQPVIDYLTMFEASFNVFPGFEVEIQGVYREVDASGHIRLHTYVVSE